MDSNHSSLNLESKLEEFLVYMCPSNLYEEFISSVESIKTEAKILGKHYKSYHPYYLTVYKTIQKLLDAKVVDFSSGDARESFLKIWDVAEQLKPTNITDPSTFQFSIYAKQHNKQIVEPFLFDLEQAIEIFKRLREIVTAIRASVVQKNGKLELEERLAFFYNTTSMNHPLLINEMNKLWELLLSRLPPPQCLFPSVRKLGNVVNKTKQLMCLLCEHKSVTLATEIDVLKHAVETHSIIKLPCLEANCDSSYVDVLKLESHLREAHAKTSHLGITFHCDGCKSEFQTGLQALACEKACKKLNPDNFSLFYWTKYFSNYISMHDPWLKNEEKSEAVFSLAIGYNPFGVLELTHSQLENAQRIDVSPTQKSEEIEGLEELINDCTEKGKHPIYALRPSSGTVSCDKNKENNLDLIFDAEDDDSLAKVLQEEEQKLQQLAFSSSRKRARDEDSDESGTDSHVSKRQCINLNTQNPKASTAKTCAQVSDTRKRPASQLDELKENCTPNKRTRYNEDAIISVEEVSPNDKILLQKIEGIIRSCNLETNKKLDELSMRLQRLENYLMGNQV